MQSIKYVTLLLANFDPLPVTLCHTSQDPPKVHHTSRTPIFSRPSTKKPNKKTHVQILCQLFVGVFVREVLSGVFCLEGFVQDGFCPFPLLSEYIHYNRKLNITLNFRFYIYDKKFISVTSHPLDTSHLSQTVTPSRSSSPSSVLFYMCTPHQNIYMLFYNCTLSWAYLMGFLVQHPSPMNPLLLYKPSKCIKIRPKINGKISKSQTTPKSFMAMPLHTLYSGINQSYDM